MNQCCRGQQYIFYIIVVLLIAVDSVTLANWQCQTKLNHLASGIFLSAGSSIQPRYGNRISCSRLSWIRIDGGRSKLQYRLMSTTKYIYRYYDLHSRVLLFLDRVLRNLGQTFILALALELSWFRRHC